LSIINIDQ